MALTESESDDSSSGTSAKVGLLSNDSADLPRDERIRTVVLRVADSYTRGLPVSIDDVLMEHQDLQPELADELRLQEITQQQFLAARHSPIPLGSATYSHTPAPPSLSAIPPDEDHGVKVAGYEVLGEIQRGGQATVFRGTRLSTKRPVAIKVIYGGPLLTRRRKARLDREVDILARIDHPHIVGVLDSGKTDEGDLFIAMELIDGPELDGWVEARRQDRSANDPELAAEILRLFEKVCEAAGEAHSLNIVHRDLKPSNVRVDRRDAPHLLDFGLARVLDESIEGTADRPSIQPQERTLTGQVVGSLYYLSPEQASGLNSQIDARSDVYSLGVMLYESLSGRPPYSRLGTLSEQLRRITDLVPPPPSTVCNGTGPMWGGIDVVVMKALDKNPLERYANGRELAEALRLVIAGELTGPPADKLPTITVTEKEPPVADRDAPAETVEVAAAVVSVPAERIAVRRRLVILTAAAVLLAATVGFLCLHDWGSPNPIVVEGKPSVPTPPAIAIAPSLNKPAVIAAPEQDASIATAPTGSRGISIVLRRSNFVRDGEYYRKVVGSDQDPKASEHINQLQVKSGSGGMMSRDSYIELDLSSIPAKSAVTNAQLRLHGFMMPMDLKTGGQMKVSAFKLKNPDAKWDPRTITWENRPFMVGWESVETALGSVDIYSGAKRWWEIDLTKFVQDELKAGRTRTTVVLHVVQPTSQSVVILDSCLTPDAPQLKLELSPASEP